MRRLRQQQIRGHNAVVSSIQRTVSCIRLTPSRRRRLALACRTGASRRLRLGVKQRSGAATKVAGTLRVPSAKRETKRLRHTACACYFPTNTRGKIILRASAAATVVLICLLAGRPCFAADELKTEAELGPVKTTLELEPSKPLIGDAVTLTLTVTAEKGVEVLMPEFGEALEAFTILEFVPRQTVDDEGRTKAVQKYRLQPPFSGVQAIPPILIEFVDRRPGERSAPEGQDAYELLTERIEFEVQSVLPKDADAQLKPPLGKLEPLAPPTPPHWPWLVGVLVLAGAASPFVVRWIAEWQRRRRRRSAYEIAKTRLDRLLAAPLPESEGVDAFYVKLSAIVRRYLEDRFDLRAPELTTEEFLESVGQSPDMSAEHQRLLRDFLRQADLVKFAGLRPSRDAIDGSVRAAQRFLEETRENAPLLDVNDDEGSEPTMSSASTDSEEASTIAGDAS